MSRGLRYAGEAEMPESVRRLIARTELRQARATKPAAPTSPPRLPQRRIEHGIQVELFAKIRSAALLDPSLLVPEARTHAVPNGGGRSKAEAGRLKAEGVRAGVSDVFCAFPAGGKHGLYIELKTATDHSARVKHGRVSPAQKQWLEWSETLGYATAVCRSADQAFEVWIGYVKGGRDDGR